MSLPPAARPPGRKLSPESKREVEKVRRVQGTVSEIMGGQKAYQRKLDRPLHFKRPDEKLDRHGYWRNVKTGRFCKIPTYG